MKDKIKHVLDECRILILGVQVLLGFQFTVILEEGFDSSPRAAQFGHVANLVLLQFCFALLLSPAAYHQLIEQGNATPTLHQYATWMIEVTLTPLAVGMGLSVGLAAHRITGTAWGIVLGIAMALISLALWYGIGLINKPARRPRSNASSGEDMQTSLKDKIDHVFSETRMVLPGAQALLGFQFATIFAAGFERLSAPLQRIHLFSLFAIALGTIFLIAPAAFHRIAEEGNDTPRVHRFASVMMLMAMAAIAVGLSADFFVVLSKVFASFEWALAGSIATFFLFMALWFGIALLKRS